MPSKITSPPFRNAVDWRFLAIFAATYAALYVGYAAIPDRLLRDGVYFYGIVRPSEIVINRMAPAEHVTGVRNRIDSPSARLDIVRGCDGAGVAFLLIAAIVAYRARFRTTAIGIAGALGLVYVLNEMRVVALYFVDSHRPGWFTPLHVYFIPTLMILLAAVYFAVWTARCSGDSAPANHA